MELDEIKKILPELLTGKELQNALQHLPAYDEGIRKQSPSNRMLALETVLSIYYPAPFAEEIYAKLYLALFHSLQKKRTIQSIRQCYVNHGIMEGSDSFSIVGVSGIGKSSSVGRAIDVIGNDIIVLAKPFQKIIPFLLVQCPFDSSVKGMLLEILRQVDIRLDTHYFDSVIRNRSTTDLLIGTVSQVCLNHIGVLLVDEIQNVAFTRRGTNVIGSLTQLINSSGISTVFIGVPAVKNVFQESLYLARRMVGIEIYPMPFDAHFTDFCKVLFSYQYTREKAELSEGLLQYLYQHSRGITAILISLFLSAQRESINNGTEILTFENFEKSFEKISMVSDLLTINKTAFAPVKAPVIDLDDEGSTNAPVDRKTIREALKQAQRGNVEVAQALSDVITVEEIQI